MGEVDEYLFRKSEEARRRKQQDIESRTGVVQMRSSGDRRRIAGEFGKKKGSWRNRSERITDHSEPMKLLGGVLAVPVCAQPKQNLR